MAYGKKLSLKAKLTLLYTTLMAAVVCAALVLLFSVSNQEILSTVQRKLRDRVAEATEDVTYRNRDLHFDSDLMELKDNVYLSLYDTNGVLLYGKIPYGFDQTTQFQDGNLREVASGNVRYYVMDMSSLVDGYGDILIRGITSVAEAEGNFKAILRAAFIVFPLIVVFAALLGYGMTKRTLAPVKKITETVQDIRRKSDFSRRIHLGEGKDEIYTLAATFDGMLDQVESSIQREQQFTSDVSHELRTPIAVILMQCDALLERKDLDSQIREEIGVIQKKTAALSQMVSQLLILSRADQGREKLVMEQQDLSELLEITSEEAKERAAEKNIAVYTDIQPNVMKKGDETLLIRMWMNLLNNAVSYGKEGGHIWIHLSQTADCITAVIRDDGIGIGKEDLPRIWDRFYQADPSRSGSESSGLGLSMVQWIVKVHGGTIQADSELGTGTIFTIRFPADG
ncbi:MAG: sensor histidine kinase [Lachnospiraceae bacterium]